MQSSDKSHLMQLDEFAVAIFLKIPGSKVAFLQSLLETYEGLATLRTLDVKNSLVAVITTTNQLSTCEEVLGQVKAQTCWIYASEIEQERKKDYFGFLICNTS